MYHFTIANLVSLQRVSVAIKRIFATVKWYNLCLHIIQTHIVLSSFLFILLKEIFKKFLLHRSVVLLRTWRHHWFHVQAFAGYICCFGRTSLISEPQPQGQSAMGLDVAQTLKPIHISHRLLNKSKSKSGTCSL